MTDEADTIADKAGRDDPRYFDEVISELEASNKDERMDVVFECLRYLHAKATPRSRDWVHEKLNE